MVAENRFQGPRRRRPAAVVAALAVVLAVAGGCGGGGSTKAPGSPTGSAQGVAPVTLAPVGQAGDRIAAVVLSTMSVAVSSGGGGQPDTIQSNVLFFRQDEPLALRLTTGTVDLLLYEGRLDATEIAAKEAFQTWTLTADQKSSVGVKALPGWIYHLSLSWKGKTPSTRVVTLVARYRPPGGQPTYSEPIPMALGPA